MVMTYNVDIFILTKSHRLN